jgi:phospholipid transport system substrate-binding protein
MHRRHVLACVLIAALVAAAPGEAAELVLDSPAAAITSLQQGLIAAATDSRNAALEQRYRALEPVVAATHDLPYIAEFALRRQWESISAADRQRFAAAFQRLSVMTYAARFKTVGASTFRPIAAEPADSSGRVRVSTAVAREGQPDVSLEYLLQKDGDDWRIINIVADGVSDLALKRAEYQRLFASAGIDGLIADLEQQAARLASD